MSDSEVERLLDEALEAFDDPTPLPQVPVQHRSGTILQLMEQRLARRESRMAIGEMGSCNDGRGTPVSQQGHPDDHDLGEGPVLVSTYDFDERGDLGRGSGTQHAIRRSTCEMSSSSSQWCSGRAVAGPAASMSQHGTPVERGWEPGVVGQQNPDGRPGPCGREELVSCDRIQPRTEEDVRDSQQQVSCVRHGIAATRQGASHLGADQSSRQMRTVQGSGRSQPRDFQSVLQMLDAAIARERQKAMQVAASKASSAQMITSEENELVVDAAMMAQPPCTASHLSLRERAGRGEQGTAE